MLTANKYKVLKMKINLFYYALYRKTLLKKTSSKECYNVKLLNIFKLWLSLFYVCAKHFTFISM